MCDKYILVTINDKHCDRRELCFGTKQDNLLTYLIIHVQQQQQCNKQYSINNILSKVFHNIILFRIHYNRIFKHIRFNYWIR